MPDSFGVVQLAYDIPIGGSFSFKVDGVVTTGSYCVGLAGFVFDYGEDDNNVLGMQVAVTGTSVQSTGDGGSLITGTVTGVFQDDHHHVGNVYAQVVLIAALPGPYAQPTLANPAVFSSGGSSQGVPLNDPSNLLTSFLTGFAMSYASSDQSVNTIGATISNAPNGSVVSLNGSCILEESSKTEATNLSLWGGLLADANSSPVFELKTYRAQPGGTNKVVFDREITQAQALLVDFHVQYPGTDTHKVKKMGASYNYFWAPNSTVAGLQADHKTFVFNKPQPFMWDDSGNTQDDSASYATYVVVGAVKTQS